MHDYQKRMIEEYKQLKERAEKLGVLLGKAAIDELDFKLSCPIELLQAQRHAMAAYLKILEERAKFERIDLYD